MAGLNPDKLKKAANVGRAISQPTAEGAKDTAAEVAKGAIKGAATGGAVGAARGAAVALAKTKAGRTLIAIALAVVLVTVMALPIGIVTIIAATSASASHGDEYRSGESVVASGKEKEEVSEAIALGNRYGIKWQLVLAVRTVEGDDADLDKLRGVLSRGTIRTIGVAAVYVQGKGLVIGESDREKRLAEEERSYYLDALEEYGLTTQQASKVYEMALKWALGEAEECTTVPTRATEPEDGSADIVTADGETHTLDETQIGNIQKIIQHAAKIEGMTKDAVIISLMAARVESGFRNYANKNVPDSLLYPHDAVGEDHDSVGFWQMRQHWGTTEELMDIGYQVRAFFGGPNGPNGGSPRGLFDIPGWDTMPKGEAAQAVEVSAFPDRYAKYEELAVALFERFGTGMTFCGGGLGIAGEAGHPLGNPSILVTSLYGPRYVQCGPSYCASGYHRGLDFGASCNTPIYAIADGTVIHAGPEGGWGNSVVIDHGNGLVTRSAHMPHGGNWAKEGTKVKSGEQIGTVGQTGNSFGCHLHFETLLDGTYIDPLQALTEMNVPLTFHPNLGNPV